jgi:hypothetical protein
MLSDRALTVLKEMQELRQNEGRRLSDMSRLMLLRELRPGAALSM